MMVLATFFARASVLVALVTGVLIPAISNGQVPLPVEEQVRLFNSLPPAQQQALIRELQQQLPPAQRQAVLEALQPKNAQKKATRTQQQNQNDQRNGVEGRDLRVLQPKEEVVRFAPGDTLVVEFKMPENENPDAPPPSCRPDFPISKNG